MIYQNYTFYSFYIIRAKKQKAYLLTDTSLNLQQQTTTTKPLTSSSTTL